MKHAVLILAVFLSLTTAAQQTGSTVKNELPVYKPVKFELHKSFKSEKTSYINNSSKEIIIFSLEKNETYTPAFKTLQDNLKFDKKYVAFQEAITSFTNFTSGIFQSHLNQRWFENRNNEQLLWMQQNLRRKQ